jgi:hypothetical protein
MRRAAKVDSTARDLTQVARQLGAKVLPINGIVDSLLLYKGRLFLVDWKTPYGKISPRVRLTKYQQSLVQDGWPLTFVSTREELTALLFSREG